MSRLALVLTVLLLAGCAAPSWELPGARDGVVIGDFGFGDARGTPQATGGSWAADTLTLDEIVLDVANADRFMGRSATGFTFGNTSGATDAILQAGDLETATISASDGVTAMTLADSTGVVTFVELISPTVTVTNLLGTASENLVIKPGVFGATQIQNTGGANSLVISNTEITASLPFIVAEVGGRQATTDVATTPLVITAMDSWAQATPGQDEGAPLILSGGLGVHSTTVVDSTQTLYTVTVTVGSGGSTTATVLTEGTEWTNSSGDNPASAILLASAIDSLSGVSAVAVAAVVHVQADVGSYSLLIEETGTGNTVQNEADGQVVVPAGTIALPGLIGPDPDTGIVIGGNRLELVTGGSTKFIVTLSEFDMRLRINLGGRDVTKVGSISFNSAQDTFFAAGTGGIVTLGTTDGGAEATMKLAEVHFTDPANGAFVSYISASESFTSINSNPLVTSNLVPAGARLLYVTGLVDTTISGGGVTDADWGDGAGDVNRYNEGGTTAQLTAGDTIDSTDYTADAQSWSTGTQDVTITFQGGTPTSGALTVTIFYTLPTAGS